MREVLDVIYKKVDGQELSLDLFLPDYSSFQTFVFFHGGGLEGGDKGGANVFVKNLTDAGVAVVSADYRLYPTAKYPDFIEDSADAVAWTINNIGKYGESKKIIVGGSSAGGYLSMMLCFDGRWYEKAGVDASKIDGYFHNAGQPTNHYNVLRERGINSLRVMIDDSAPLYHIGEAESYPPMRFIVSEDGDLPNRYEQTMLTISAIKNFGYDQTKVSKVILKGGHCEQDRKIDENGNSVLGTLILDFIQAI